MTFSRDPHWAATAPLDALRGHLLDLICERAYREGEFVLSSGQHSPYYINGKQVTLDAQGGLAMGRLLGDRLPAATAAVAGLTLGADPMVTAVSVVAAGNRQPVAALIVRKAAKGHGTMDYIEGPALPAGSLVVVLEDVVTTGGSAMKAVQRLRDAGYTVNRIIALVDRQQGGAALYAQEGLAFDPLYTIEEVRDRWAERRTAGTLPIEAIAP